MNEPRHTHTVDPVDYLDAINRAHLLVLAYADGYALDDSDHITNPGRFEAERVDILYWHAAFMEGCSDDTLTLEDCGEGVEWFTLGADDGDVLGWPRADYPMPICEILPYYPTATHARLSFDSRGFVGLSYHWSLGGMPAEYAEDVAYYEPDDDDDDDDDDDAFTCDSCVTDCVSRTTGGDGCTGHSCLEGGEVE